jgi:AraC-like DNA-binding protein
MTVLNNASIAADEAGPLFVTRRPHGALAKQVELLWLWHSPMRSGGMDRMMPTGAASLILNLQEDEIRIYDGRSARLAARLEGAVFVGVYAHSFAIDTAEQVSVAGVSFYPGGAWPFMRMAQHELSNAHVPLREIWGTGGASLRERIVSAATPQAGLVVLERALEDCLCRPLARHPAVTVALREIQRDPLARIGALSERCSLSSRRLSRVFELEVGMTPKRYARLLRFRRVLSQAHGRTALDWAELALECGYHDQPHLIHDFKAFSGFTPSEYLSHAGEFANHVPIDTMADAELSENGPGGESVRRR